MPTYRYRCAKCADELEIWQSFEDKPLVRHNGGCGGKLAKVMSPAGIVLKGSGFYKTDNRSKSTSSPGTRENDSGSSSSSESKASDSKSGTKEESKASKSSDATSSKSESSSSTKKEASSAKS